MLSKQFFDCIYFLMLANLIDWQVTEWPFNESDWWLSGNEWHYLFSIWDESVQILRLKVLKMYLLLAAMDVSGFNVKYSMNFKLYKIYTGKCRYNTV